MKVVYLNSNMVAQDLRAVEKFARVVATCSLDRFTFVVATLAYFTLTCHQPFTNDYSNASSQWNSKA